MLLILAVALELFADWVPDNSSVDQFLPMAGQIRTELRVKGWELKEFEKTEENTWVFWNLGEKVRGIDFGARPKEKMVLFVWEPPIWQKELHDPKNLAQFGKVFTWDDDLIDNKHFFKFHYPVLRARLEEIPQFEKKKFCTMISRRFSSKDPRELYSERESTIRFFEDKKGEFDLYGMNWEKRKFKNYRGAIADKIEVLKDYKFSICYENMKDIKGYITEKIFDCFAAGVVPVYWGASNVTDYIPEGCFVDRRKFKDNKALYKFLKGITKAEYEQYLKNAEVFLKSDGAKLFSPDHFAKTFVSIVD